MALLANRTLAASLEVDLLERIFFAHLLSGHWIAPTRRSERLRTNLSHGDRPAGGSSARLAVSIRLIRTSTAKDAVSTTVITFGTFDVLHVGHLRVIERARGLGDRLVVGVSSDALTIHKKGRAPVFSQPERLHIVGALRMVDEVFLEESLERKREYILAHKAGVLVMGDDWAGKFDEFRDICQVVYLPRTPAVSTTAIIEKISGSDTT